ncbi:hypothetical protein P3X46_007909 [Hevea brasiliensis]|uniref:Cyclic nucleotide-binding domain-containing protein n=1 Tax=Hevea brasiliensis TaxID=3981 RepID=A0ABQ9MXE3_HEVBR|nr:hypothetical protein P3X46_007909 [Hevea brasiliensis]
MEFKKEKLVRFNETQHLQMPLPVYKVSGPLLKSEGGVSDSHKGHKIPKFGQFKVFPENHAAWRKPILDPGSDVFLQWNRVFLFFSLVALFVDPLFFYLPSVINNSVTSCMDTDLNLGITVTCFRTFADIFYALHIVVKFRTAYVAPSSRVFGRGELVMDPKNIARRYLKSDFFTDLIASLPLPQIVIWFIIPIIRSSHSDHTNSALVLIVLLQYVPSLYLIFPLSSQIIKATGVVTKTAWAGAAYNLLPYMLASHVLGASWYLLSIERHATCWKSVCTHEFSPVKCKLPLLHCSSLTKDECKLWQNSTQVFSSCDPENSTVFYYGIFANAVTQNVVSFEFLEKYFYCLWWGLQNLRVEAQATNTEEWMRHRQLPQNLREQVRRFVKYKWLATRGVDEESILHALPKDLRRDIQRHLCLDIVRRVPFFSQMDDQLLDAICERLVSSLSTQGTYIVREGDPVIEMLFVIRGRLESSTTNGGRTGFFNSITLRPGDFCGEELLAWALLPKSVLNLPSTRGSGSICITSRRSQVCGQSAAWYRHKKTMMAKTLSMSESFALSVDEKVAHETAQEEEEDSMVSSASSQAKQNLGVTILASRFAANTRRGAEKIKDVEMPKLQKPEEPDFSTETDDE